MKDNLTGALYKRAALCWQENLIMKFNPIQFSRENRMIYQADAIEWLGAAGTVTGASFVSSLPDYSEFPSSSLAEWKNWFVLAVKAILESCPDDGVAIFYQRDSKKDGAWIDKGYLCQKAAEQTDHAMLWHKIVCRVPPGQTTFGKPSYSHLLCFSRKIRLPLAMAKEDVIVNSGKVSWARGMGVNVCKISCEFILEHTATRTIVDPFCGHGTVLAVANHYGLNAVGVELGRKRAEKAALLELVGDRVLFRNQRPL
jgi:hypothetical protein